MRFVLWVFPLLSIVGGLSCTSTPAPHQIDAYAEKLSCASKDMSLEKINRPKDGITLNPQELTQWLPSSSEKRRAVALAIHGVNQKPSTLGPLLKLFQDSGVEILRVGLPGTRGSEEEQKTLTLNEVLEHSFYSYCLAKARANELKVPLIGVGYSYGGLILETMSNLKFHEPVNLEGSVYLTPAIALRKLSYVVQLFRIFGKGFVIPSASNLGYRANSGTAIATYDILFSLREELLKTEFKSSNHPTLVIMDPKDYLVSYAGIQGLIDRFHLVTWKTFKVDTSLGSLPRTFHHLVVDERCLGATQWQEVRKQISEHLETVVTRFYQAVDPEL